MRRKKAIMCTIILLISVILYGCGSSSPLKIEGANSDQISKIQQIFNDLEIEVEDCEKVSVEDGPELAKAMAEVVAPYDITAKDGEKYRLTIKHEDYSVVAITRSADGEFIYGGISDLFQKK